MSRRPLDPRICNVAIDANALNRDGSDHDKLVDRLLALRDAGTIRLLLPKRVREEILDPRTPGCIQQATAGEIFTIPVGMSSDEQRRKQIITAELQGNANPGKHEADADHLFEVAKYGGYFITHDDRILKRAGRLREVLPPSLTVVKLSDFLVIFDDWRARCPRYIQLEEAHLRARETEKQDAIAAIETALAEIGEQRREPDQWERVFLSEAIGATFRGCYRLACTDVSMAMTPTNERAKAVLPQDPFYDRCTIALLRDALRETKAEPVRPFPHFGPIVFTSAESSS